jgi:hypothetical protein
VPFVADNSAQTVSGRFVPDKPPSALGEFASAAVRPVAKAVAAAPLMAMDAGVAARNLIGDAANKVLGRKATPDYTLPSTMFNQALDTYTDVPPTALGKAAEFASSALLGSRVGVPEIPAVARAVKPEVAAARSAGYVVPPTAAGGSKLASLAEGVSGKVKTAQAASLKNQSVTNDLVRSSLGLAPGTPLTVDTLRGVRAQAGKAYDAVKNIAGIQTDPQYQRDIAAIGAKFATSQKAFGRSTEHPVTDLVSRLSAVKSFDGDEAVNEVQLLRDEAEKAASQRDKGLASAYHKAAGAIESQIERHAAVTNPKAVPALQAARQLIAKSYTIQSALDRGTGDVSAQKLSQQLAKDRPLSGGLKQAAKFATAYPKAAQLPSKVGSVTSFSPLDLSVMGMEGASGLTAAIASGNTKAAAAAAVAMAAQAARPAIRAALLTKTGQRLAIEGAPRAAAAAKRLTLGSLEQAATN